MMEDKKIGLINGQMGDIAKEIGAIGRDSENTFHKYNFRSIDQVYNVLGPLMAKHGVFCTVNVQKIQMDKDGKNRHVLAWVDYWFTSAIDGSRVYCEMVGEGMDSGDKAVNKAYAAAHKYCLLQVFAIPTEEQRDGDFESPESIPDKPKRPANHGKPKKAPPVSVQETDDKVVGMVENLEHKMSKGNKPYIRLQVGGIRMAAWETPDITELVRAEAHGFEVGVTYVKNGKFTNVTSAMILADDPPVNPLDDPNYSEDNPPPIDSPVQPSLDDVPF